MPGCVNHTAFIYDRGGLVKIGELDSGLQRVRWERIRDAMASATVTVTDPGGDCAELLGQVRTMRHEGVIFRGNKRVFEGPITRVESKRGQTVIDIKDIVMYANRTAVHAAYNNAHPNIDFATARAERIIRAEMARKEALGYNLLSYLDVRSKTKGNARTSRSTKRYQLYVYDELEALASRGGMDYTTVGRSLLLFDTNEVIGRTRRLSDDDFIGDIILTEYGAELGNISIVTDGQGRWGKVGKTDPFYGEAELLHTVYDQGDSLNINERVTTAEMTTQAGRNAASRFPAPVVLRVPDGTTLHPDVVDELFDSLVAGMRVPLTSTQTVRQVTQEQKIDRLVFEETADGETVKITLSPAPGLTPWADEGQTSADADGGEELA